MLYETFSWLIWRHLKTLHQVSNWFIVSKKKIENVTTNKFLLSVRINTLLLKN